MNPEIEAKFAELEKRLDDIENARSVSQTESIRKRVLQDIISAGVIDSPTSSENTSTTVPGGGGTVNHPAQYDLRVRVTIDGADYYVGLYNV